MGRENTRGCRRNAREDIKGVSERDTHEASHQRRRPFEGLSVHPSVLLLPVLCGALQRTKPTETLFLERSDSGYQKFSSGEKKYLSL